MKRNESFGGERFTLPLRVAPLRIASLCVFLCLAGSVQAAGITQHQFMAEIGVDLTTRPDLAECMASEPDAYMMGAAFPDCGWVIFNDQLASEAHSKAFIDAFVDHIQATYVYPYANKCRLVSFMMGVAAHVAGDPPYHGYLIPAVAEADFNGNTDIAHTFCDGGLEFTAIVDYDRWDLVPQFWLPIWDIQQTYARLGSSYPAWKTVGGNVVLVVAAVAERWVADYVYRPLERIMPWAVENYYSYPKGGIYDSGVACAAYYDQTWDNLMTPVRTSRTAHERAIQSPMSRADFAAPQPETSELLAAMHENRQPLYDFARRCLDEGVIEVDVLEWTDREVSMGEPRIVDPVAFEAYLGDLVDAYLATMPGQD